MSVIKNPTKKDDKETKEQVKKMNFPYISIEKAIEVLEKAYEGYNKSIVIPFKDFENVVDLHGGTLASVVRALKDYGLMDKQSKSQYLITELGKKVLKEKSKNDILNAWLSIKIHKKVYSEYGEKLLDMDKKAVEHFLTISEKMSQADATTLSRLILESVSYMNKLHSWKAIKSFPEEVISRTNIGLLKLVQLKFLVDPPQGDFSKLAEEVAEEYIKDEDVAISTIAEQMKENKDDKEYISKLVKLLIRVLERREASQILEYMLGIDET